MNLFRPLRIKARNVTAYEDVYEQPLRLCGMFMYPGFAKKGEFKKAKGGFFAGTLQVRNKKRL